MLLLDEPLGALDLKLRRQMQLELKRIQTEVGITFVHVTHDQEEAMTMADTIAVMNAGRVEQMGAPTELYENPATTFVANFLGRSNLIAGQVTGRSGDDALVERAGPQDRAPQRHVSTPTATRCTSASDPEKISLTIAGDESGAEGVNTLEGVITDASFIGVSTEYLVHMPWGQELAVFAQNMRRDERLVAGAKVALSWDPAHTFALDASQAADAGVEIEEGAAAPDPVKTP